MVETASDVHIHGQPTQDLEFGGVGLFGHTSANAEQIVTESHEVIDTNPSNVNHNTKHVDTFFEFGMYPLINVPTRITDEKSSVLDHFWSNITDKPVKSAIIVEQISDHLPICLNLGLETAKEKSKIK